MKSAILDTKNFIIWDTKCLNWVICTDLNFGAVGQFKDLLGLEKNVLFLN